MPPWHIGLKLAAAALFVALAVLADDARGSLLTGVAALGFAGVAVRDLLAPVRLAADAEGVTVVSGFVGHVRIPWAQIREIRVDDRRRLLVRSRLLELRTEDDLHLLSAYDLGTDPAEVETDLTRLRDGLAPGT